MHPFLSSWSPSLLKIAVPCHCCDALSAVAAHDLAGLPGTGQKQLQAIRRAYYIYTILLPLLSNSFGQSIKYSSSYWSHVIKKKFNLFHFVVFVCFGPVPVCYYFVIFVCAEGSCLVRPPCPPPRCSPRWSTPASSSTTSGTTQSPARPSRLSIPPQERWEEHNQYKIKGIPVLYFAFIHNIQFGIDIDWCSPPRSNMEIMSFESAFPCWRYSVITFFLPIFSRY